MTFFRSLDQLRMLQRRWDLFCSICVVCYTATVTSNYDCKKTDVRRSMTEKLNNAAKAVNRDVDKYRYRFSNLSAL